jgi:hypothetical protein
MHERGLRAFEAALQRLLDKKPKDASLKKKWSEKGRVEITQGNVAREADRDRSNMVKNYPEVLRKIRELNAGLRGKAGISLTERYREAVMKTRELALRINKLETYIASLELSLSNSQRKLLHEKRHNRQADDSKIEKFPQK